MFKLNTTWGQLRSSVSLTPQNIHQYPVNGVFDQSTYLYHVIKLINYEIKYKYLDIPGVRNILTTGSL